MKIPFTKMHGLGNDFVVVDHLASVTGAEALTGQELNIKPTEKISEKPPKNAPQNQKEGSKSASQNQKVASKSTPQNLKETPPIVRFSDSDYRMTSEQITKLAHRRFGVGCDQVLWITKAQSSDAAARMEIWNSDGSKAEMCGNGLRAVALHMEKYGPCHGKGKFTIETVNGLHPIHIRKNIIKVDIGQPTMGGGFNSPKSPASDKPSAGENLKLKKITVKFFEVGVGNPHAVLFDVDGLDRKVIGKEIEFHSRFPERTNVEFVQVIGENHIKIEVWERGAGLTMACGSGACAAAVAAIATGRAKSPLKVELPGGDLIIEWSSGSTIQMEGPAGESFRGAWEA